MSRASHTYGKDSDPVRRFIEADQSAALEILLTLTQDRDHRLGKRHRIYILCTNLKDTGSSSTNSRQDCPEIQIMCEYHISMTRA
jgi:hypothetical protein